MKINFQNKKGFIHHLFGKGSKNTNSSSFQKGEGFTLVELLVVISIIGLLSSLAIMSFSISRQKSRDGKRLSDLNALSKAIQIYQIDNGYYPPAEPIAGNFEYSYDDDSFIGILVEEGYMGENLADPINSEDAGQYYFYGVFGPGSEGGGGSEICDKSWGQYYILALSDLEGYNGEEADPRSFPYTCGVFNIAKEYDYYVGNFGEK